MERKATIAHSYQLFALTMLTHAIVDYHSGYKEECMDFLETDVFQICCELLEVDEKRVKKWMLSYYKNKRKLMQLRVGAY